MSDPIKTLNAPEFIDLLRELNPHIPSSELITRDTLTITTGVDELTVLNLSIFITLPTFDQLAAREREKYPLVTAADLGLSPLTQTESATAWTLDGQAVTVDITHIDKGIDEETRDG